MAFIIGIYWADKSPDTLSIRMRELSDDEDWVPFGPPLWSGVVKEPVVVSYVLPEEDMGAVRIALLMYESAIVNAPAVMVAGLERSEGDVEDIKERRLEVRVCSICAKGRYLLGSSGGSVFFRGFLLVSATPFMTCSCAPTSGNEGVGYSHCAFCV